MSIKDYWKQNVRRLATLVAVKPLMMIYGLQFAITFPVATQLWLDRTCRINLGTIIKFSFLYFSKTYILQFPFDF